MARPASSQPTEVELQILSILWELGPSGVKEIHARRQDAKGTNYSTTVKMLSVMLDKGYLQRDEQAAPHIYKAVLTQRKAQTQMLNHLIDKVYNGSARSLVLHVLSAKKATRQELDEIRRLLDSMTGGKP